MTSFRRNEYPDHIDTGNKFCMLRVRGKLLLPTDSHPTKSTTTRTEEVLFCILLGGKNVDWVFGPDVGYNQMMVRLGFRKEPTTWVHLSFVFWRGCFLSVPKSDPSEFGN